MPTWSTITHKTDLGAAFVNKWQDLWAISYLSYQQNQAKHPQYDDVLFVRESVL